MVQEETKDNKKIVLSVLGVLLLLVLVGGISYAAFSFTQTSSENTIKTGKISMSYIEPNNAMIIENALPTNDTLGKASTTYFEFTVTSHATTNSGDGMEVVIPYEINLSSKAIEGGMLQIPENKLKVHLVKVVSAAEEEVVGPTLISSLSASTIEAANTKLYNTEDKHSNAGSAITTVYRLRAWIDESMDVTGNDAYQYKFTVNINSQNSFVQQSGGSGIVTPEPTDETCFTYTTDAVSATITGYKCFAGNTYGMPTVTDLVIPNELGGKPVTEIAAKTGKYIIIQGVTTVKLNDSLEKIGKLAFTGTLTSIDFGNNSHLRIIEESGFGVTNLTGALTIPASVETIGKEVFKGSQLTSVTFENGSNLITIGDYAFDNNNLTGTLTIPASVETIGIFAFAGVDGEVSFDPTNQLTGLIFENGSSLISIGKFAFRNNAITLALSLPDGIITIGENAFAGNNISGTLSIPASVETIEKGAFQKNATSNSNLTGIINQTVTAFNWGLIINGTSGYNFVTGTVVNPSGNVTISGS